MALACDHAYFAVVWAVVGVGDGEAHGNFVLCEKPGDIGADCLKGVWARPDGYLSFSKQQLVSLRSCW